MVRSMTGFGRAEASGESIAVTVEARSVNHRHLDVALRLPRALAALELDARRLVQSRLERGRVEVTVQLTPLGGAAAQRVQVDGALAREYVARAPRCELIEISSPYGHDAFLKEEESVGNLLRAALEELA